MLLKRALATPVVVSLESDIGPADAAELDPMQVDKMIDESAGDAEDAEAALHKLHAATTSLEELHDFVGQSGVLNAQGAQALGIALEHIVESIGFEQPSFGLSLEDFDEAKGKDSTQLVLESISETLERAWTATMAFIDKLIQWFRDVVGDNLGYMGMLSKRADKIKGAISHVKEWKVNEVHDSALCARLYSPEISEKNIVPAYHDALATIANSFAADNHSGVTMGINSAMARIKSGMLQYGQAKKDMWGACEAYAKDVFGNDTTQRAGVPKAPAGSTCYSTPVVLGGIGWYYHKPNDEAALNQTKIGSYHGKEGNYEQLRSLGEGEVKHVLASFKTIETIHKEYKLQLEKLNTYRRNLEGYVRGTSQHATGAYSEYDPRPTMVSGTVRTMFKLMIGVTGSSYAHAIRLTRDMFRLCEISMAGSEQHQTSSGKDLVPA